MSSNSEIFIKELEDELNQENRSDLIKEYEELLSDNIEEISNRKSFFKLPLKNILSIVSNVNFYAFSNCVQIMKNIIKNTISAHKEEKETIYLIQNMECKYCSFSLQECVDIIQLFKNSELCTQLGKTFYQDFSGVNYDYEYELQEKDRVIEQLKEEIEEKSFPMLLEKPEDFEPDIIKAAKSGKQRSVQYLIEHEDCNSKTKIDNNKLLWIACENGHLQLAHYLIEKTGAYPEESYYFCQTPLHIACENGHLPIVQYLIEKLGVDKEPRDYDGNTPLHYACRRGHLLVAQYLIEVAHVNTKASGRSNTHATPLHLACANGELPVVKYLVGLDEFKDDMFNHKWSPLHAACESGQLAVVKFLIERAGFDKEARDEYQKTPLHLACRYGWLPIVQYLIEVQRVNREAKNVYGYTPLAFAIEGYHRNIISYLKSIPSNASL